MNVSIHEYIFIIFHDLKKLEYIFILIRQFDNINTLILIN